MKTCPKCGGKKIKITFHGTDDRCWGCKSCQAWPHEPEHLCFHCETCHYEETGPCKDAPKEGKR